MAVIERTSGGLHPVRFGGQRISVMVKKLLAWALGLAFVLYFGFGIEGGVTLMPGYSIVLLDDDSKTLIALPCYENGQYTASEKLVFLRKSTWAEARALKYQPDKECMESGAFRHVARSVTGALLEKLHILPPNRPWWDRPGQ